ncbi:unnamed protein product [Allacma fusca]|uniref:Uncharacterized protein n=1 Tax=Allacma fusca TaxID=39272 RepID=A0A8J2KNC2_9HEXA|nr:unnamed protein product [Allacma fusca]
MDQGQKLEW